MVFFATEKKEKYINVKMAAALLGITPQAVNKATKGKNQTIPAERIEGEKKTEIRIPVSDFLVFLKDEKTPLQDKLKRIEQAENTLRRL